jgi:hypothetical protein
MLTVRLRNRFRYNALRRIDLLIFCIALKEFQPRINFRIAHIAIFGLVYSLALRVESIQGPGEGIGRYQFRFTGLGDITNSMVAGNNCKFRRIV